MGDTRAKDHGSMQTAFPFDSLETLQFSPISLTANQANSVVQERIFLPTAVKIYRVIAGFGSAPGVAGTCSINIVAGTAAETGTLPTPDTDYAGQPAYPPAYASAGQSLFLADQVLTMTADTATVLTPNAAAGSGYPANTPGKAWDALWGPGGAEITLRTVTNGAAAGRLYVALLVKYYDPTYNKPVLTGFNAATDIP